MPDVSQSSRLTNVSGVKVYGFLTVSGDAKCGVCAHELGHLGEFC